jgi:hypothetical protein
MFIQTARAKSLFSSRRERSVRLEEGGGSEGGRWRF